MDSPKFTLSKHDGKRVVQIFIFGLASFCITFLLQTIPQVDFGQYGPLVTALIVPLLEMGRRYFAGQNQ